MPVGKRLFFEIAVTYGLSYWLVYASERAIAGDQQQAAQVNCDEH